MLGKIHCLYLQLELALLSGCCECLAWLLSSFTALVFPCPSQLHPSVCPRTVLLSGILGVLEEEFMREALEIHFQKPSKGGGEVEVLAYVPPGQRAVAVFGGEESGANPNLSSAEKFS